VSQKVSVNFNWFSKFLHCSKANKMFSYRRQNALQGAL